jgi:AcrR family transcriptional regulator
MLMAAERDSRLPDFREIRAQARGGDVAGRDGRQGAGFGREQIALIQRARILAGLFDVVAERGAASVTVADIVERAGVSRRTFYELFADREQCMAAGFDEALDVAVARVLPAVEAQDKWVERLRAGLAAFLRFLDEEPKLGRLLVCESLSGGAVLIERRAQAVAQLAAFVQEGGQEGRLGEPMAALQAEGSVGGALSILQNLLAAGHQEAYVKLVAPLTAMIVMPYLGTASARRELDREAEPTPLPAREPALLADPLKDAGMRLTYRTVRVLIAVAERPGASNRALGNLAGIADQGQISKLLRRLQRIGLIENTGAGAGQGAPNAWRLTATGAQLTDRVGKHAHNGSEG